MPPVERERTLLYRRCTVIGGEGSNYQLQEMVTRALTMLEDADARLESVGDDGSQRLANDFGEYHGMVVANLVEFTRGNFQTVISLEAGAKAYKMDQLAPKELQQFLEGMLFFGVHRNHVVAIQSKSVRIGQLEAYLNWLLESRGLPDGAKVMLRDHLRPTLRNSGHMKDVEHVTMRTRVPISALAQGRRPPGVSEEKWGLWRVLRGVVPNMGGLLDSASIQDALDEDRIDISFTIKRAGRRRTQAWTLLDDIADAVRNSEDIDFDLYVPKVGHITRADLRLTGKRAVQTEGGTALLVNVADVMHEWLTSLVDSRRIRE
jgi:hypothetical protein